MTILCWGDGDCRLKHLEDHRLLIPAFKQQYWASECGDLGGDHFLSTKKQAYNQPKSRQDIPELSSEIIELYNLIDLLHTRYTILHVYLLVGIEEYFLTSFSSSPTPIFAV